MNDIAGGRYAGLPRPETMSFGQASGGGDQVAMTFELRNEGYEGRTVTWFASLVGGAIPITLRQLRDAGWRGDSLTDTTGLGETEVPLDIKYEEWNGKERMKVEVGRSAFAFKVPIAGAQLAALDAKLRGAILQSKRPVAGAKPAAWKPTPAAGRPAPAPAPEWDGTGVDPDGPGPDELPY